MSSTRSERGAALLLALAFLLIVSIILGVAASHSRRVSTTAQERLWAEDALLEARGGVHWAAARLARDAKVEGLARTDPDGALKVVTEGDRIESTYTLGPGSPRAVVRRVSARWRRGRGIELFDWREE